MPKLPMKANTSEAPITAARKQADPGLTLPERHGIADGKHKVLVKTVQTGPHQFVTGFHFHPDAPAVQEVEMLRGQAIDLLELIYYDNGGSLYTSEPPKL